MRIDVTSELPQVVNRLNGVYSQLDGNLKPLLEVIGSLLIRSTEERFRDSKVSPEGVSWAELLPSTSSRKGHSNILHEFGNLSDSFSDDSNNLTVTNFALEFGTDESYGKYHQTGTANMVARPFLGISEQDESEIMTAINDFVARAINADR